MTNMRITSMNTLARNAVKQAIARSFVRRILHPKPSPSPIERAMSESDRMRLWIQLIEQEKQTNNLSINSFITAIRKAFTFLF